MDIIRVLRVIEYTGPRDQVEEQVLHSIQGERRIRDVVIRAATLGTYPEVIEKVEPCHLLPGECEQTTDLDELLRLAQLGISDAYAQLTKLARSVCMTDDEINEAASWADVVNVIKERQGKKVTKTNGV